MGLKGGGRRKEGEMIQTLYAHMNKDKKTWLLLHHFIVKNNPKFFSSMFT
jgi:hypothetical protein